VVASELRFYFITSDLTIRNIEEKPAVKSLSTEAVGPEAFVAELNENPDLVIHAILPTASKAEVWQRVLVSKHPKCIRCWHYRADVGANPAHPEICLRCVSNVDGPGEDRKWF
jgi:isoleucyl-tRNA synthetase